MKISKVIAITLIALSFAGCSKDGGGSANHTSSSKTVRDDWKKLDPGRYAAMDDSSILRRWGEIDCTGTIKKEVEASGGLEALIASVAVGYMATPANERENALMQIETLGQMYGIVNDFVKETVTEAEDAQTIFTNGSLDEEIRDECKRRGVALEPCSMMKESGLRDAFAEKMTNGSAVAQMGFDILKRNGIALSPTGFSGVLYRHGGMADSVRVKGVESAEKLAERILDLWKKGAADAVKDGKMKQKFLFVQWRIARIARLRAVQEQRAGMVEQSSRSRRIAEELDECNPGVKKIKAKLEAKRKGAMDGMSPREQLRQALRRADFESAREPAATVLEGDPDDVAANFALGMWHYVNKRWNDAEKHLLRCKDKNPEEAAVWNNLALIYMQLGKLDVAIQYARQALALLPSSGEIKDTINQIEKAADRGKAKGK